MDDFEESSDAESAEPVAGEPSSENKGEVRTAPDRGSGVSWLLKLGDKYSVVCARKCEEFCAAVRRWNDQLEKNVKPKPVKNRRRNQKET